MSADVASADHSTIYSDTTAVQAHLDVHLVRREPLLRVHHGLVRLMLLIRLMLRIMWWNAARDNARTCGSIMVKATELARPRSALTMSWGRRRQLLLTGVGWRRICSTRWWRYRCGTIRDTSACRYGLVHGVPAEWPTRTVSTRRPTVQDALPTYPIEFVRSCVWCTLPTDRCKCSASLAFACCSATMCSSYWLVFSTSTASLS